MDAALVGSVAVLDRGEREKEICDEEEERRR
jgi:hypothetical protein